MALVQDVTEFDLDSLIPDGESESNLAPFMLATGFGQPSVVLGIRSGLGRLKSTGLATASASLTNALLLELQATGQGTVENTFIRVNDEANVFLQVESLGTSELTASFTKYVDISTVSNGTSLCSLNLTQQSNPELDVIHFMIDILPAVNVSRYRQYHARCSINGSNLPIASFSLRRSSVSSTFTARLANLADRSLIIAGASFKFEIGETVLGTTTWRTIFDTAKLSSRSYSIGMADSSPTDTFSFSTSSNLTTRLMKTPIRNTVYYDPYRTTVESTAIEVFYDTGGQAYASQVIPFPSMKLYTLFQEVFVTRCGFTSYVTNLPNYPIKRADFPFQRSYYESLRGLIGMFDLSISTSEDGTIVYIRDTTNGVPAGFPSPRTLTTTKYKAFQRQDQESRVQALRLNYISNETELTYKVQRLVQTSKDLGNGLTEETDTTVFDIYSVTYPTTVLRTIPDRIEKRVYQGAIRVATYNESYTYNSENRPTLITKTQEALLPTVGLDETIDETLPVTNQRFSNETTRIEYSEHPYVLRAVYQKQIVTHSIGLVVQDTENTYLGQPFYQSLVDAHRAGNAKDGMQVFTRPIETVIENYSPQPNGQVKAEVRTINHIRDELAVTNNSDERAGDAAISYAGQSTQRLLVLGNDGDTLTGAGVEDFHIGELPLYLGIPLARRKLKKMRTYQGTASADLLGLDLDLLEGIAVSLTGRDGNPEGNIVVTSVQIVGNALGTENQDITQTIEGERINV